MSGIGEERWPAQTCLEEDVVRHEFVGHLRENLSLQSEVLRLTRLFEDEYKLRRRTNEPTIFPWDVL